MIFKPFMEKIFWCLCLILCHFSSAWSQFSDPVPAIEKLLNEEYHISPKITPGFILGIVLPDTNIVYAFGNNGQEDSRLLSEYDIFELAGLTKVFTSTLINQLTCYDTSFILKRVNELLSPDLRNPQLTELTIVHLLEHRSGLPFTPFGLGKFELEPEQSYAHYPKDTLLRFYQRYEPSILRTGNPGNFSYAHINYALLEVLIESYFGEPYTNLMRDQLFVPLKMHNSSISAIGHENTELAPGFDLGGNPGNAMRFSSFGGALGMCSSLSDLITFSRTVLNQLPVSAKWRRLLSFSGGGIRRNLDVDNGWYVLWKRKKPVIYSHSGHSNMHSAYMHLVPETGIAVIILANSSTGTPELGLKILDLLHFYRL